MGRTKALSDPKSPAIKKKPVLSLPFRRERTDDEIERPRIGGGFEQKLQRLLAAHEKRVQERHFLPASPSEKTQRDLVQPDGERTKRISSFPKRRRKKDRDGNHTRTSLVGEYQTRNIQTPCSFVPRMLYSVS
jgi:hypothetical protein